MKITINKTEFLAALLRVKPIVSARANIPALSCFKLKAKLGVLTISASNLEQTAELELTEDGSLKIEEPGGVLLSAARLIALAEKLDGEISMSVSEKHIAEISASSTFAKLHGFGVEDFPEIPALFEPLCEFEDTEGEIARGLAVVKNIAAPAASRHCLRGVNFGPSLHGISVVGSDGNRVQAAKTSIDVEVNATVPLAIVRPMIEAGKGAKFTFTKNRVGVTSENIRLTSVLIEDAYLNWKSVIPGRFPRFTVGKSELLEALSVVAITENKFATIGIKADRGGLMISSASETVGCASYRIEGKFEPHEQFFIRRDYLFDAVSVCPSEQITIENEAPHLPVVIREDFFTAVISPRRNPAEVQNQTTK